jgi:hypothetical protein
MTLRIHEFSILRQLLKVLPQTLAMGIFGFLAIQIRDGTTAQAIQSGMITGVTAFITTFTSRYLMYQRTKSIPEMQSVEVYISPVGIYTTDLPERLLRLTYSNLKLTEVTIQQGTPSILEFKAQVNSNSGQSAESTLQLPIPNGSEDEAESLMVRFQEEIIDVE